MTHFRSMFDAGTYLGAWHLSQQKDAVVMIEKVEAGTLVLPGQKTGKKKPVVSMAGKTLKLALNKTNAKTIARLYGDNTEGWVGKPIALYVGTTRDPESGGQCACIRVRPTAPSTSQGANIDERATPEVPHAG